MIEIERESLVQFKRDMKSAYEKMHRKALLPLIKPSLSVLKSAVRAGTPKRTGFLQKSIRINPMRGAQDFPYAAYYVGFGALKRKDTGKKWKAYYGIMVHNGTIVVRGEKREHRTITEAEEKRRIEAGGQVRIKPNPWVLKAFEQTAPRIASKLLFDLSEAL